MVEIVWTEPALNDLDAIADYIALDKPEAARELVQRLFAHVEQLGIHPDSGSKPVEFPAHGISNSLSPRAASSIVMTVKHAISCMSFGVNVG